MSRQKQWTRCNTGDSLIPQQHAQNLMFLKITSISVSLSAAECSPSQTVLAGDDMSPSYISNFSRTDLFLFLPFLPSDISTSRVLG